MLTPSASTNHRDFFQAADRHPGGHAASALPTGEVCAKQSGPSAVPEQPRRPHQVDAADGEDDGTRPLAEAVVGHAVDDIRRKRRAADCERDRTHYWPHPDRVADRTE